MMHLCTYDEDGNWDGLVGELVNRRADIAVGAIRWVRDMSYLVRVQWVLRSVMAEREAVIDFTVPYYDLVGTFITIYSGVK